MLRMNLNRTLWWMVVAGIALIVADHSFAAEEAIAKVVGIKGSATAMQAGQEARVLRVDSPIYAGDQLETARDAGVGLLLGTHYVGLDESTRAQLGTTVGGSPDVKVTAGRARVLESGASAPASLATPGLLAANAGTDTDVFAFPEKGGLVSMICPNEGSVTASRGGQNLASSTGDCTVAKLGEPLYAAKAGHPPLGVLGDFGSFDLAGDPSARLGSPLPPVALGLQPAADGASPAAFADNPRIPCDSPAACNTRDPAPRIPPTNPPRPGNFCTLFPTACQVVD